MINIHRIRRLAILLSFTLITAAGFARAAGDAPALPADWEKQSAVFRGPAGSGRFTDAAAPATWNEKAGKNVLWKTRVPMAGLASPVVWGDKVFLSGATREKREVYAFTVADGKPAWTGTYESSPEATEEYEVYDSLESQMHAAPTPAVDGKRVYAIFANGELVAFDIKTGKALWSKVIGDTSSNMYGYTGSLLAYKESVIVQFDGETSSLLRLDGATGKKIWGEERNDNTWASPILIKTPKGAWQIITAGDPEVSGWDPETGKQIWAQDVLSGDVAPSPVYADGLVFACFQDCGIFAFDPDTGKQVWSVEELESGGISDAISMVAGDGFVYHFFNDSLACINAKTGDIVYEETIDGSSTYASPMLLNGRLYLFHGGKTTVIRAGAKMEVIGSCQIEDYDDVSPAVAGGKIFLRTAMQIYAIGSR
jgi:outer membrane protein assembly factor BamB